MSKYQIPNNRQVLLIVFMILLLVLVAFFSLRILNTPPTNQKEISFIPFGDSFTIGLGVGELDRWPNIMIENLRKEDTHVDIISTPAVSGHIVSDVITYQLPVLETQKPDFITIFIGTNDSFAQVDLASFKDEYRKLLDEAQKHLRNPKSIVLVTVPDYSVFPGVIGFQESGLSKHILAYNTIIADESIERGLVLADIYPISKTMTDGEYFIADGFHPTRLGYEVFEGVIRAKVTELLDSR